MDVTAADIFSAQTSKILPQGGAANQMTPNALIPLPLKANLAFQSRMKKMHLIRLNFANFSILQVVVLQETLLSTTPFQQFLEM